MTSEDENLTLKAIPRSMVFQAGGREVMRITPEGELIIHDATEAAKALKREWDRLAGIPDESTPHEQQERP